MDLAYADIPRLRGGLLAREYTASEVAHHALERIRALDGGLNTLITVDEACVLARARAIDALVIRGEDPGPLAGVPLAVKDNMLTRGLQTTAGSRILDGFLPLEDADVVTRLERAGALIVGKSNLDEFAMGSSTENSAFGPTRNPWETAHVPGGSSGGSAAAVAAGLACLALGSDTGGSIRQPAALCGVFGLKPTWGRVSRYGLIAFASSLDQIGPFARSVEDLAALLGAIAGHDPRDSTCSTRPVPDYAAGVGEGVAGLRIGVPEAYFGAGTDPEVEAAVRAAIDVLVAQGAEVVAVELPDPAPTLAAYYVIAPAEASSNLARYDGVRYGRRVRGADLRGTYEQTRGEGFGAEVKRRIMLGTYALSAGYYEAYYGTAQRVRAVIRAGYAEALTRCDVIVTPTSPIAAPALGEKIADPLSMYLMDICTIGANLAGVPALSAPCGFTSAGLPIGVQLIGRHWDEATLLRVAAAHASATDHHTRRPALAGGAP